MHRSPSGVEVNRRTLPPLFAAAALAVVEPSRAHDARLLPMLWTILDTGCFESRSCKIAQRKIPPPQERSISRDLLRED